METTTLHIFLMDFLKDLVFYSSFQDVKTIIASRYGGRSSGSCIRRLAKANGLKQQHCCCSRSKKVLQRTLHCEPTIANPSYPWKATPTVSWSQRFHFASPCHWREVAQWLNGLLAGCLASFHPAGRRCEKCQLSIIHLLWVNNSNKKCIERGHGG